MADLIDRQAAHTGQVKGIVKWILLTCYCPKKSEVDKRIMGEGRDVGWLNT